MTLIRYGRFVWASAGIFIAGVLVWNTGDSRNMRESVAEVVGAYAERVEVAYLTGTNAPDLVGTNYVVEGRKWFNTLYGAMDGGRDMALDNEAAVYWIDPEAEIDHGDAIAGSGSVWELTDVDGSNYTYAVSDATNVWAGFHTTGSRLTNSASVLMPDVIDESEYLVMCEQFFSGASYKREGIFGDDLNWWNHLGLGTNLYKYACEHWYNVDGDDITVTLVGGTGFSNIVTTLYIPYPGGSRAVDAVSTDTNAAHLCAALYKAQATGRDDAWFVASDATGATALNIYFSAKTVSVNEGSTVQLDIRPATNSGGIESITWSVIGQGVEASYFGATTLFWGGANPPWSTTRPVYVAGLADADSIDDAAVIRFSRSSQPGQYQYVAVRVVDTTGGDGPNMAVDPVLVVVDKEATAEFDFTVNQATNTYMVTDKRTMTTNLVEGKILLQSLRRTVAFFSPSQISYDSWLRYRHIGYYSTNVTGDLDTYNEFLFADALAQYNSISKPLTTVYTNSGSFNGEIVRCDIDLTVENDKTISWDDAESGYYFDWDYNLYSLEGCSLPYPGLFAITNGLIDRLRIYLCVDPSNANRPSRPQYDDYDAITFNGYSHQPWLYDRFNYSNALFTALCSADDGVSNFPADGQVAPSYNFPARDIITYRLCEIVDIANPSNAVTFAIGGDIGEYDFRMSSKADFMTFEIEWDEFSDGDTISSVGYYEHGNVLDINTVIVVVDWNWEHLNPSVPFAPATNTPPWAL